MMHRFDERKALNVALYLIPKVGEFDDFLYVLYLANKLHLKRHGRSIVSDTYEHGIGGLGMVAVLADESSPLREDAPIARSQNLIWNSKLIAVKEHDPKFLSKSDVEVLDDAVEIACVLSDSGLRNMGEGEDNALREEVRRSNPSLPVKLGAAIIARSVTDADVVRTMRMDTEMLVDYLNGCD